MENLQNYIDKLNKLNFKEMYEGDFFLTWEKTDDELEAVFTIADALRYMREHNISTKIFESGLGISLFRDNSTRTRFSFASACNLLGLELSLIHIWPRRHVRRLLPGPLRRGRHRLRAPGRPGRHRAPRDPRVPHP